MLGTVAVTDYDWWRFLSLRALQEVNFWTPSDRRPFTAPEFSPFFFKLKAPYRVLAGFGYFARWSRLPEWLAWECFGEGNGCESFTELEARLAEIRARIRYVAGTTVPQIGCVLLVQPTFFAPDAWIPQPNDWKDRTVSSKGYDLTSGEGARIWQQCLERSTSGLGTASSLPLVAEPTAARYGTPYPVVPRLGQGTFRVSVTDAYDRACAVTGEHSLPALDAAHIRSFRADGPHATCNGVLLRVDLHRLFDKGYVTVTREHRLEVSSRLRTDYSNGRSYYPLHGTALRLPTDPRHRPADEYIRWHNEHVYRG